MSDPAVTPPADPVLLGDLPKPPAAVPIPDHVKAKHPTLAEKFKDVDSLTDSYATLESELGKLRRQVAKPPDEYPKEIVPDGMTVTPELWAELKAAGYNTDQAKLALAKIHGTTAGVRTKEAEARAKEISLAHQTLMTEKGFSNKADYDAWRIGLQSWANGNLTPAQIAEYGATVDGMKAIELAMMKHAKSQQLPEGGQAPAQSRTDIAIEIQKVSDQLWKDPNSPELTKRYSELTGKLRPTP